MNAAPAPRNKADEKRFRTAEAMSTEGLLRELAYSSKCAGTGRAFWCQVLRFEIAKRGEVS